MSSKETFRDVGLLWLRVAGGIYLMSHGVQKIGVIFNGAVFAADFQFSPDLGLGPQLAFIGLALSETLFALLVVIGLFTRVSVLPVIFSMCVAAFVFHAQPGQSPFRDGENALLYAIAFTTLLLTGPGEVSMDRLVGQWWGRRRGEKRMITEVGLRPAAAKAVAGKPSLARA
ncbi:MAG: DoxX family protein [Planctomycetes bacterium]|nr:DoxX family protein [Planctomycetota bacterium]